MTPDPFRLGVNYWPSDAAMAWLAEYDGAIVRRDFARIAAAGMDTVRVFVRWEDVQPWPDRIEHAAVTAVLDCADAAAENGVGLIVTLFTGHMSGANWIPTWATGGSDGDSRFRVISAGRVLIPSRSLRNWYGDPAVVDAQARLARSLASALAAHPGVWAWDLGNENSNCTVPPSRADGRAWLDRMTSALRAEDPDRAITIGLHMEDLENDRMIGPADAAAACDIVCMHGYPAYASWSAGPLDDDFVPFLAEITRWLAGGAPVLFEELGQSTVVGGQRPGGVQVTETDGAAYTGRALDRLRAAGAIGALLWCFSDYVPARFVEPPFDLAVHERSFGLWRADGTAKPAVAEMSRRQALPCAPVDGAPPWIDISVDELHADRRGQLARLYERYRSSVIG